MVTDPDCFGVGDVADLLDRDMGGKAVMAVPRPGHNKRNDYVATSVMLLDCAKLTHWDPDKDLDDLFAHRFDYIDWIELKRQPRETIGLLEPEWNDFDRLTPDTKILHTTKRRTQPWKTGPTDRLHAARARAARFHPPVEAPPLRPASRSQPGGVGLFACSPKWSTRASSPSAESWSPKWPPNHIRHDSLDLIERYRGWNGLAAA